MTIHQHTFRAIGCTNSVLTTDATTIDEAARLSSPSPAPSPGRWQSYGGCLPRMPTPSGVGRSPCRSGHDRVPGRSARGRRAERPGGAGFSTALKLRAAATEGASLVVNACDGEYGAIKDGYVVAYHLSELVRGAESLGRNGIRHAAARGSASEAGCVRPG